MGAGAAGCALCDSLGGPFLMNPLLRQWDGSGLKMVGRGTPFGFPTRVHPACSQQSLLSVRTRAHGFLRSGSRGLLIWHVWSL